MAFNPDAMPEAESPAEENKIKKSPEPKPREGVSEKKAKMIDEAALQRAYGELEDKRRELAMSPKERGNPNPIENPLDVTLKLGQKEPQPKPQPKKGWLAKLQDNFLKKTSRSNLRRSFGFIHRFYA